MDYTKASKRQLEVITLYENCNLEDKYKAAAELQRRQHEE